MGVVTREDHLHEVRVVQLSILISVKELDQVVAVSFSHVVYSVVSEKIQYFHGSNESVFVPVHSLEKRVRLHDVIAC